MLELSQATGLIILGCVIGLGLALLKNFCWSKL